MRVRDPFGLTLRAAAVSGDAELVVLPRVVPLPRAAARWAAASASEGSVPHMVALHGEDDQTVREYRDGDDLRRIHWPATARTGDLMVRQEDRPADAGRSSCSTRGPAPTGSGRRELVRVGVTTAASVVTHLAGLGYATHLICSETVHDGQAAMTTDADHALDLLAEAETGPERELAELVRAAHPVTASGGLVVAVLADRDEESLRQVASLRQPGGSGLAIVLDTATFADSPGGAHTSAGRVSGGKVDRWVRRRAPTPSCCIPRAGRSPWPGRATASPRCGPH